MMEHHPLLSGVHHRAVEKSIEFQMELLLGAKFNQPPEYLVVYRPCSVVEGETAAGGYGKVVYPLGFQTNSPQALVTAWRLEQPVEQDYTVYVHFVDPDGQVVKQADHHLWTWANQAEGPTSTWETNKIYLDIVPLPQEVIDTAVPLQIVIGLWIPESEEYLQAEPVDLTLDEDHRLVIGTIMPPNSQ